MFDFLQKSEKPTRKKISYYNEEAKRSYEQICMEDEKMANSQLVLFAENWASLMEKKFAENGNLTSDIIDECRKAADKQCRDKNKSYYVAKHLLIVHWKYGDLLMSEKDKLFYNDQQHTKKFFATRKKAY